MKYVVCILMVLLCFAGMAHGAQDTLPPPKKSCVFKTYPPHIDTLTNKLILRNQQAPFGRKLLRGSGFVFGVEAVGYAVLLGSPKNFSQWDRGSLLNPKRHYTEAFTMPPVVDDDVWYINYVGHPYQGAFSYNIMRSQGATFWQSGLFTLAHSFLWEYVIESSAERPSVQDLVVTPIAGSLLGELIHFATVKMSRNGFTWYESVFVCVFNPAYILNNGFKFARPPRHRARRDH